MEETPRAKDVILLKRENRDHYLLALPNIAEAANFDAESKIYSEHAKKYLEEIKIAQQIVKQDMIDARDVDKKRLKERKQEIINQRRLLAFEQKEMKFMDLYSRQSNNALYGITDKLMQRQIADKITELTFDYNTVNRPSKHTLIKNSSKTLQMDEGSEKKTTKRFGGVHFP